MLTITKLRDWHAEFNRTVFANSLGHVDLKVSDLGPDIHAQCWGTCIEVNKTLDDHEARAGLLHEMVHQWQHEQDYPMDHGPTFTQWGELCRISTGLSLF